MRKKNISIVAEIGTGIYAALPIVKALKQKNFNIYIYTSSNITDTANYLKLPKENIIAIGSITNIKKSVLDLVIKLFLKHHKFSSFHTSQINSNYLIATLNLIFSKLPKPNLNNINNIYNKIWNKLLKKKIFKSKNVLVITRCDNNHLLNSSYHNYFAIVESWDHPVKASFFFLPKTTFVWNDDLKEDVINYQSYPDESIINTYPLKFRYLEEINEIEFNFKSKQILDEIDFIDNKDYVLFICSYSKMSGNELFNEQLKLIYKIFFNLKKINKILYIKPHPHSVYGEFDELKSLSKNLIKVGIHSERSGFGYLFSDEDQAFKIQLLTNARMIINLSTTLVLESSKLNHNICQIKVDRKSFPFIYNQTLNTHIVKYINSRNNVLDLNKKDISSVCLLAENPNGFSEEIKNWAFTRDYQESILNIISVITK